MLAYKDGLLGHYTDKFMNGPVMQGGVAGEPVEIRIVGMEKVMNEVLYKKYMKCNELLHEKHPLKTFKRWVFHGYQPHFEEPILQIQTLKPSPSIDA